MKSASRHARAAGRENVPTRRAGGRRRLAPARIALFACLFLLLAPSASLAVPPSRMIAAEPSVSLENDTLLVHLSLTVDHEDGLRDMLKDGAVLQLGISISLERKRSWWTDAESAGKEYVSSVMHDPLSRDFILLLPGPDGEKELRDKNLTRLLHRSWRVLALPLTTTEELSKEDPEAEFRININVGLRHTDVPPWLEKSIIWSSDVVPAITLSLPFSLPAGVKHAP